MNVVLQTTLPKIYNLAVSRGLVRFGWGRRLFFALYDIYKLKCEAGRIKQLQTFGSANSVVIDVSANVGQ